MTNKFKKSLLEIFDDKTEKVLSSKNMSIENKKAFLKILIEGILFQCDYPYKSKYFSNAIVQDVIARLNITKTL